MSHYDILKNKNVLVTGVTGGVGKNITKELLNKGCNIFATGCNESKLKKVIS